MTHASEPVGPTNSAAISYAFWSCLFFCAGLYGLVALAPRVYKHALLEQRLHVQQQQLVALSRQSERVGRVIQTLETDPNYARDLALMDFRPIQPGEQRLAVDEDLTGSALSDEPLLDAAPPDLPWYFPIAEHLTLNESAAKILLAVAAIVVIYAFACLHDNGIGTWAQRRREASLAR
jgi:hypothetical protein